MKKKEELKKAEGLDISQVSSSTS